MDNLIEPQSGNSSIVLQYSDTVTADRKLSITVPHGYQAIVLVNEKPLFRINECTKQKIVDLNRDVLNKKIKVVFVTISPIQDLLWGFGGVSVLDSYTNLNYSIGANGRYSVKVVDAVKVFKTSSETAVNVDLLRKSTVPMIKAIAAPLLYNHIVTNNVSVDKTSFVAREYQELLAHKIKMAPEFERIGLELSDIFVDDVYVDEDDLERVNTRREKLLSNADGSVDFESVKAELLSEISAMVEERISETLNTASLNYDNNAQTAISRRLEEQNREVDQRIDILTARIESAGAGKVPDMTGFQNRIKAEIKSYFDDQSRLAEERLGEMITNSLPLHPKAENAYIEQLQQKISARTLIDLAKTIEDFIPSAAMIYSNVEKNMVSKKKLTFKNKRFLIETDRYGLVAEKFHTGNVYPLKKKNLFGVSQTQYPKKVIEDGREYYEMIPPVRFFMSGMNADDAIEAGKIWTVLNKIRHQADDGGRWIKDYFEKLKQEQNKTIKQFFLRAIELFEKYELYDADKRK